MEGWINTPICKTITMDGLKGWNRYALTHSQG